MPITKPTITDEHKEKYAQIMNTAVRPAVKSPPPANTQNSKMNALLAALPKPKGIGNKMFIFTGKKKIIVDGKEREEEKVKMIDPALIEKNKKDLQNKEEDAKKAEIAAKAPPTPIPTKPPEAVKGPAEHTIIKRKKPLPKPFIYSIIIVVGLGAWTLIWLYVFGYIHV